jgi:hypothetical protein
MSRIFKEQAAAQGLSTANLYASTLQQQMSLPRLNTRRSAWAAVRKATPKAPVPQQVSCLAPDVPASVQGHRACGVMCHAMGG